MIVCDYCKKQAPALFRCERCEREMCQNCASPFQSFCAHKIVSKLFYGPVMVHYAPSGGFDDAAKLMEFLKP